MYKIDRKATELFESGKREEAVKLLEDFIKGSRSVTDRTVFSMQILVDFLAQILDVGAEDAASVDPGRVDDEESPLETADAHLLERTDDGCLGTREVAAEVATEMICVDRAFHRCCKDKSPFGGFYS